MEENDESSSSEIEEENAAASIRIVTGDELGLLRSQTIGGLFFAKNISVAINLKDKSDSRTAGVDRK